MKDLEDCLEFIFERFLSTVGWWLEFIFGTVNEDYSDPWEPFID